jgi:CheY-like chemotaxis protein
MLSERSIQPNTIVVVEDEFIVRDHAVVLLEELGFRIADFNTADEALAYVQENAGDVFAIFTDLRVPGVLDGLGLARTSHSKWPWIRIVVSSASTLTDDDLPPQVKFIPKPWLPLEVIAMVSTWAVGQPGAL